jgi:dipeptidase D
MDGAVGFDPAWLRGRKLLNLDSEEEGQMIVSAAGGCNVTATLPLAWEPCTGAVYRITVEGLQGGHSGAEIHRGLGNANMILGKILSGLRGRLISFNGGNKANAVPRSATALVVTEQPVEGEALTALFRREYGEREPALTVTVTTDTAEKQLQKECSEQAIALLSTLPDGVQAWSQTIEGLVETSLNCGIVKTEGDTLSVLTSLRSMVNTEREALYLRVKTLMERCGAAVQKESEYPAWEYREESPLRETVAACYRKQTGKEMKIIALHAGLECGLLSEKLPGLDSISMGPDMKDIHTPRERISVSSIERTWELLKEILKNL